MPTSADDRLSLIQSKIDRANHHLGDLEKALKSFVNSNPYKVEARRDPQTRKLVYFVSSIADTPLPIAAIAGDALQCARSALDHLAYQLVLVGGGAPTIKTQFPIVNREQDYKGLRNKALPGMRDEAMLAIDATRPYPDAGGNIELWRLYRLNNVDKHRVLLTVASRPRSADLGAHASQLMRDAFPDMNVPIIHAFFRPAQQSCLQVGDTIFTDSPDAKVNKEMQFAFEVALNESGIVDCEPLLETVAAILGTVEVVASGFRPHLT